ncbi:MAG TPA: anthranilate synthase component I family protein [Paludibacteraceae bacterium]|nr:anthranilate synthase component I family protein [Paludibacteraceae bacterium]HPQ12882.1 anthranilate synthase component I family protein [Paludibacteraceae bacterium]
MKLYVKTKKMLADLETPVGIYLKIRDLYTHSVLLESSDYHAAENSYSFIAFSPIGGISVNHFLVHEYYPDGTKIQTPVTDKMTVADRFDIFLKSFERIEQDNEVPAVVNGLFGYTSYEAVQYFEDIRLSARETVPGSMPGLHYVLFKYIIAVNHFKNELTIIENLLENEKSAMNEIEEILLNNNIAAYEFSGIGSEKCDINDEDYRRMVKRGKEECFKGNVFQIVLSRRFYQQYQGDDFMLYRTLRSINPSPYLFYFDFADFRIFGSSPEAHLVVDAKAQKAYIKPIAGTFRRTGDDIKDLELAEKLKNDEKENAEHVMLVDLARNDLSRNADEVKVETFREVQYYSHVIHLVSCVSGKLRPGTKIMKFFADTFPAGTLSGAPKIKAMQLIDQIEPHDRGPYGGCIGYIGFDGGFNQAITIRSFISKNNTLFYQAGAGIVAKSDEENELQEVNNKLAALKQAIILAGKRNNYQTE